MSSESLLRCIDRLVRRELRTPAARLDIAAIWHPLPSIVSGSCGSTEERRDLYALDRAPIAQDIHHCHRGLGPDVCVALLLQLNQANHA